MNKLFFSILSFVAFTFAANIQIIAPTGANFSPDAPDMVATIIRSAVSQAGHTPTEQEAPIQITTNLMTMGSSIVVVCEQKENGVIVGSGKQKAASLDDLDVAIEQAVASALATKTSTQAAPASQPIVSNTPAEAPSQPQEKQAEKDYLEKTPARKYKSIGFGLAYWHNWEDEVHNPSRDFESAYALRLGYIWENSPATALVLQSYTVFNFSDESHLQEVVTIGGRYLFNTGSIAPYIGAGFGFGVQADGHFDRFKEGFAFGLAGDVGAGVVFFQKSSIQMEVGLRYNILWDGLTSFSHNFGAASAFIAINF